jgi:hypothetical protein
MIHLLPSELPGVWKNVFRLRVLFHEDVFIVTVILWHFIKSLLMFLFYKICVCVCVCVCVMAGIFTCSVIWFCHSSCSYKSFVLFVFNMVLSFPLLFEFLSCIPFSVAYSTLILSTAIFSYYQVTLYLGNGVRRNGLWCKVQCRCLVFPMSSTNFSVTCIKFLLTGYHAMEAYWGSGGIAPRSIDLGTTLEVSGLDRRLARP